MNILYIGPYRQKSLAGIESLFFIKNLLAKPSNKITIRPLYLNDYEPMEITDGAVLNSEKSILSNYDIIIQNISIKDCIKIHKISKNIIVPILDEESIYSSSVISNLCEFDCVLTDKKASYHRIINLNSKLSNKVKTYDYSIPIQAISQNQFDIGLLSKTKKLYFIGNYQNNLTNIQNLCRSFIKNIQNNECSLLLFLFNMNQKLKQELDNFIAGTYSGFNIKYAINRVIVAPIDTTIENILIAHQTGDAFIDLQDDGGNSSNVKIASILKKEVVSFNIEDYGDSLIRNNKLYKKCTGVSVGSIDLKIQKVINNKYNDNLIPFKKEHINNII